MPLFFAKAAILQTRKEMRWRVGTTATGVSFFLATLMFYSSLLYIASFRSKRVKKRKLSHCYGCFGDKRIKQTITVEECVKPREKYWDGLYMQLVAIVEV